MCSIWYHLNPLMFHLHLRVENAVVHWPYFPFSYLHIIYFGITTRVRCRTFSFHYDVWIQEFLDFHINLFSHLKWDTPVWLLDWLNLQSADRIVAKWVKRRQHCQVCNCRFSQNIWYSGPWHTSKEVKLLQI